MLQQNARTVLPRHGAFGAGPAPRAGRVGASPIVRASAAGKQPSEEGDAELQLSRRQALAAQLVLVAGVLAPAAPARAEEAVEAKVEPGQMKQLTNGTLAYQFEYPTSTTSGASCGVSPRRPADAVDEAMALVTVRPFSVSPRQPATAPLRPARCTRVLVAPMAAKKGFGEPKKELAAQEPQADTGASSSSSRQEPANIPPPVAPRGRVVRETPQVRGAGGRGAVCVGGGG
ncbi:hypothetical protein TSOC_005787 [Tetrabaena socialis]|uniref:PsbP C-terminal domain-containing protein n=1 Tax=Tetrabaena socialis TaxID=47790 RepID=A0A2J8A5F6_9CHLO|nr:hypothetical protein TSOC_005787 [Tetrabaena socialis]|eukprot:PNH07754.1 hypothetical protein TSOC_005787 [Tetrabaena socialis]